MPAASTSTLTSGWRRGPSLWCKGGRGVTTTGTPGATKDVVAARRAYYAANRERILANRREHYRQHKEKLLTYSREYYQGNKDKIRGKSKRWYEQNRERKS